MSLIEHLVSFNYNSFTQTVNLFLDLIGAGSVLHSVGLEFRVCPSVEFLQLKSHVYVENRSRVKEIEKRF